MVPSGRVRSTRIGAAGALGAALLLAGCGDGRRDVATVPDLPRPDTAPVPVVPPPTTPSYPGVWHEVAAGQTLWRIARVYGVDMDELARANGIADPTALAVGQRLLVPGATATRLVPPYPAPLEPSRAAGTPAASGGFLWPVEDGQVLSGFGAPRGGRRHGGIDIGGEPGEPVRAAQSGRVVYSGSTLRGYGRTIILDHGGALRSLYAHNEELVAREGDVVERGQVIGRLGRTGNASTHHCHFEIREHDVPVDPLPYLQGRAEVR